MASCVCAPEPRAGARIPVSIDIGFRDALEPDADMVASPPLLDLSAPTRRAYAREPVIAGTFQAMVALARVDTRMKDVDDIWILARTFERADDRLARDHGDLCAASDAAPDRDARRPLAGVRN